MRLCVFLAGLLSLVLTLSKGNEANEPTTLTPKSPTATEKSTETSPTPTVTTGPTATEKSTETSPTPTVTAGPTATEKSTETSPTPTVTAGPTATEKSTETSPTPTVTAGPTTTEKSTETSPTPTVTAGPTTTGDLCKPDSCGEGLSECVPLHSTFTCVCQYGFYYSNKDCHKAKIFPGVITLKEFYSDSVQTVNSVEYEEVFQNVTTFFQNAFSSLKIPGQTVIVEIQPLKEGRASLPVSVTVTNLFAENSDVSNETVFSAINSAIENSSYVSGYRATTYCDVFNCDALTTYCEERMFPKCMCKSNFSKTEWDDRSCSDCSKNCSAEGNMYCAKENGVPTCRCLPDFERNSGECVLCPVGFSGENCKNNSELILIIVGTVFGAIILSLVIAVAIVSVRSKQKPDPEKTTLIKSGYSSSSTFDDRQTSMFPRVQTTSGHVNTGYQPNNPYEMRSTNKGRFPERDYDDLYEISREPEGFRMQRRY